MHIDSENMRQTWLARLSRIKIPEKTKEFVLRELESSLQAGSYLN